ncbi:MAG: MBL fold metallo-hydrolase [archaeon]|nr:MBL fold metallo-hydrolase [archaeon]
MKIKFLGTGGGRFASISQKRMTGGFRIDNFDGKNYHVDPGPGALVRTYQFGLNPADLDGIFVSHSHTDHYNDAEILIEAMTKGMTKNNGIIMGSQSVFEGFESWGPAISKYHRANSKNLILTANKSKKFPFLTIKGTKTMHGDPTCVGFQIENKNGFKISYTSDTKYFDTLHKYHKGADILIASVLRHGSKSISGHMCSDNFAKLIQEVNPKLAIMTHFGFKMLAANPIEEAKRIYKDTGVRTLAAFDGMLVNVNENHPEKSGMTHLKSKFYSKKSEDSKNNYKQYKKSNNYKNNSNFNKKV